MELNKTQEHFLRVFKNDLPVNDFIELKGIIKSWLGSKLTKPNLFKSSRYCLNSHLEDFKKKCAELDINIYSEFPSQYYTWMQIEGDSEKMKGLESVD